MLFVHNINAGNKTIIIENSDFHSLIRVRRKKKNDTIVFVNITNTLPSNTTHIIPYYTYRIVQITKKSAQLECVSQHTENVFQGKVHLFWGICEIKTITSTLPILNQIGVEKITFVQCERSQGNIKITEKIIEKLEKILRSSCEQCGRNTLMKIDTIPFSTYIEQATQVSTFQKNYICDFQEKTFSPAEIQEFHTSKNTSYSFFIGPEGGFTDSERQEFQKIPKQYLNIRKFNTPLVLKSESACITVGSFFM